MTKKKSNLFYIFIMVCVMLVFVLANTVVVNTNVTSASTVVEGTDITDSNLYDKLCDEYFNHKGVSISTLDSSSFADFTYLDLSDSGTNFKITSLAGLDKFNLQNLKVLVLSNNNISSIEPTLFTSFKSLQCLVLDNNLLTALDLSKLASGNNTWSYPLKYIDVSNNNLATMSLTKMIVNTTSEYSGWVYNSVSEKYEVATLTKSYINLAHNKFDSISDVTLPSDSEYINCSVYLQNNNIIDFDATQTTHYSFVLGIQGLRKYNLDSEETDTTYTIQYCQKIKYYNMGDTTFSIVVTPAGTTTPIKTITDSTTVDVQDFDLPVGEYRIDFKVNNVDIVSSVYTGINLTIVPTTPSYYYLIKGEKYLNVSRLTEKATIVLEADEGAIIKYCTTNSDVESDWVEATSLSITKGGSQTYYVKSELNGVTSSTTLILVYANPSLVLPPILIIVLGIAFLLVLAFVVTPLIRRYVIKE